MAAKKARPLFGKGSRGPRGRTATTAQAMQRAGAGIMSRQQAANLARRKSVGGAGG